MIYRESARRLPLLEGLRIASPCAQSWDDMIGNERVRFCRGCGKNVHDLSAVTREEAEAFVQQAKEACVRLHRRADGTVLTSDCPSGRRHVRGWRAAWALGLAGIASAVLSVASFVRERPARNPTRATVSEPSGASLGLKARATLPGHGYDSDEGVTMGMVLITEPADEPQPR